MDKHKDSIFENHTEQQLIKAVLHLLPGLFEKNESFRIAVETSLSSIATKNPDLVIVLILEFREKTNKIDEKQLAILYQLIETIIRRYGQVNDETMERLVKGSLEELIKIQDLVPTVQKPIIDTLIALSRMNATVVLTGLMNHLVQGQPGHFMLLHTLGDLSTANTTAIVPYLRRIFSVLIPTMELVRNDHLKQAYSFALGKFSETLAENISELRHAQGDDFQLPESLDFASEVGIAYDTIFQQWLHCREAKVCTEVLLCLAHMFPLQRPEKVSAETCKLVPVLLGFYRKTVDRLAITKCLGATIHTAVLVNPLILEPVHGQLIGTLFDLICVNPDYEKPHTVKGHYEVLRCFDLLTERHYDTLVMDTVRTQLRSNMERDRIKSLQLLVHFCSTREDLVRASLPEFTRILRQMVVGERVVRMKMHLLKTVVAFAQKGFVDDKAFLKFILRFACEPTRTPEGGAEEEEQQLEFRQTCNNSLYILSGTVATVDDILKRELLSALMLPDYYTALPTIAKCLARLFERSLELPAEELPQGETEEQIATLTAVPHPVAVFVRCLVLLDNPAERKRANHLLMFLKAFAPVVDKHLPTLWNERVAFYLNELNVKRESSPLRKAPLVDIAPPFLLDTIRDIDGTSFVLQVLEELKVQRRAFFMPAAEKEASHKGGEFRVVQSVVERGNLYKLLGICLSQLEAGQEELTTGIEILLETARGERMDKATPEEDTVLPAIAVAFEFVARKHFERVFKDLMQVLRVDTRKSPSGMFSKLNFVKENQREAELFRVRTFVLGSLQRVVENFPKAVEYLRAVEEDLIEPLLMEFREIQSVAFRQRIIDILLRVCQNVYEAFPEYELRTREGIFKGILTVEITPDSLQLLPKILTLGTILVKMNVDTYGTIMHDHEIIHQVCNAFFSIARRLKTKFDSAAEDEQNSQLAGHLTKSLPQLIAFVQVIVQQNPTPACLDVITTIVERWAQDANAEVRISAGHVIREILSVYIRTMQFGGEAPSKFNQTGLMVGKTVPRCIDSNATVRQLSVDILRKIFEISCIYETLVIPTEDTDWVKRLAAIRAEVVTNDSAEILRLTNDLAGVLADRLPQMQYKHFCSTLVLCVDDTEHSSAVGATVLLAAFVRLKGQTLSHNLAGFVDECLQAVHKCSRDEVKVGLLKVLVALTKHFPQQVCGEMLKHELPFDPLVGRYWRLLCKDTELATVVLEHFLATLNTSCLVDTSEKTKYLDPVAAAAPLKIFYVLKELLLCAECKQVARAHFEEVFMVLVASLACYINTGPPLSDKVVPLNGKAKGLKPPPPLPLPADTVLGIIEGFLALLEMEQLRQVFHIIPDLAEAKDLWRLVELNAPLAVALGNTLGIHSGEMKRFVVLVSKFTCSTYEAQRIASVSLLCQFLTLSPTGEVVNTIMLHLNSSLNDPNLLVRCCAVRGLGNLRYLSEYDANAYLETSLMALINALDVSSEDPLINIPLESLRGLQEILGCVAAGKVDNLKMYTLNLAIRIRPFLENRLPEIRETAISLLGQLCVQQQQQAAVFEEFEEQLHRYFFPLLLHLSEAEGSVVVATRNCIKKAVHLMGKRQPAVQQMIEKTLLDYGHLNYDIFLWDLLKVVRAEFSWDLVQQSIESCLPFLKSAWPELRGNAMVVVAVLGNHLNTHPDGEKTHEARNRMLTLNHLAEKAIHMLKDEDEGVRVKAALSMGHLFANI